MHESDALFFIETVLEGFCDRIFEFDDEEDIQFKELYLEKTRSFIQDKEPHWVKAKSLEMIYQIELAETSINKGKYIPSTPETFINSILDRSKERITELAKYFQCDNNKSKTSIFVRLPSFPL